MREFVSEDRKKLDCSNSSNSILSFLIVDDNEITRSALAHLIGMKMPTASVHAVDDYAASVGLCSRHHIDIVITDLKRASLRSPDIFERILSLNPGIKLILTTGSSDRKDLAGFSNSRVSLLEKPVDLDELFRVIGRMADEKSQNGS